MSDVFDFDTYIMAHFDRHPPLLHFAGESREEWYVWQKRLRARLLDLMEPFPEQVPLEATLSKSASSSAYITRKWCTPPPKMCKSRRGS